MVLNLSVVKIVEWSRTNSTSDADQIVLIDRRDTLYTKQLESGEAGTEYLKKITLDLASGTAQETILTTATDGIAFGGLKVFGKNIVTRRFGGYGEVGGNCSFKGVLYDLDNVSNYICLCDGAYNCNLTSNLAKIGYDPVSGYLICGGGCGGRWIWVIDPDTLNVIGRASESYIRDKNYNAIELVPRDDEKAYVIIATGKNLGTKYLRIGIIDIQDLIDNISSNPNIDQLGSWEELYTSNNYYKCCWIEAFSNGDKIIMCLDDGTGRRRAIYDPSSNTLTDLGDVIGRKPLFMGWYGVDTSNQKHIIYSSDGSTILQEIADSEASDKANPSMWFVLLTDTTNQKVIMKGLSLDGSTIPWIEWDFVNNKFRVVDFITGSEITVDVILMWSRLQYSVSQRGTLPYIANNRVQKITVSGWTDIPNPPSSNVRVLYVIPDFIGVSI